MSEKGMCIGEFIVPEDTWIQMLQRDLNERQMAYVDYLRSQFNDAMTALTNATETIKIKAAQIQSLQRENEILKIAFEMVNVEL